MYDFYVNMYDQIFFPLQILLVSSSRHTDQWIVPGGGVEPEETHSVAAMREVVEEAGVKGHIDRCLGVFQASAYFIPQSVVL